MSVFVSYRREDSAGHAGRIGEHLIAVFGAQNVFLDVEDIAPGQDFAQTIERTIGDCQAVVVVIGRLWVQTLQERGEGEDFVREEVSAALRRGATVIPVLVGGALMPSAAQLPQSLAALSRRQAVEIRDGRFDDDVTVLIEALQKIKGMSVVAVQGRRRRWLAILLAALCVALIAGMLFKNRTQLEPLAKQPTPPASSAVPFDIAGTWIAEMQKPGRSVFRVKLELAGSGGKLIGTVEYPTGEAAIQAGKLENGNLSFFTTHTPNFASEPATLQWTGVIEGAELRLTEADDGGMAKGIARRRP
ncbi:MAG: toll/interleukin-1 receptor domain-containing protein [Candidatus Solibacter sp.]